MSVYSELFENPEEHRFSRAYDLALSANSAYDERETRASLLAIATAHCKEAVALQTEAWRDAGKFSRKEFKARDNAGKETTTYLKEATQDFAEASNQFDTILKAAQVLMPSRAAVEYIVADQAE